MTTATRVQVMRVVEPILFLGAALTRKVDGLTIGDRSPIVRVGHGAGGRREGLLGPGVAVLKQRKIQLRREIYREDIEKLIEWLGDEEVNRYLNEEQNVRTQLRRMLQRSSLRVFSAQFSREGSTFFMITRPGVGPIGFLRLVAKGQDAEVVVVIGDRSQWGRGLGYHAVLRGLYHALFTWRKRRVLATIHRENERSKRLFRRVGMRMVQDLEQEVRYAIDLDRALSETEIPQVAQLPEPGMDATHRAPGATPATPR
jgi:RimJ/RimL family protein N-acetyltransferase